MTLGTNDDNFIARLQACLLLQKQYRDMLRALRDSFGASHSPAVMSNNATPAGSPMKRPYLQAPVNPSTANTSHVRLSSQVSTQGKNSSHCLISYCVGPGTSAARKPNFLFLLLKSLF